MLPGLVWWQQSRAVGTWSHRCEEQLVQRGLATGLRLRTQGGSCGWAHCTPLGDVCVPPRQVSAALVHGRALYLAAVH